MAAAAIEVLRVKSLNASAAADQAVFDSSCGKNSDSLGSEADEIAARSGP